ncbi:extensin-like [Xiphophorus maculatus]|uniref:extensin-like n=1 Tax=Xiphophorus maculatus TaxID=8083 RepID=UPI000C6CAE8F|nr:extensin-like [Xiphophorus maculatus]
MGNGLEVRQTFDGYHGGSMHTTTEDRDGPKQGAREPVDLQLPEGTGGNTGHVHTASPGFHATEAGCPRTGAPPASRGNRRKHRPRAHRKSGLPRNRSRVPENRWTSSFPREPEETPATCTPQVRASTQPKQGAREPVHLQLPEGTGGNTGHVHTASPGFHATEAGCPRTGGPPASRGNRRKHRPRAHRKSGLPRNRSRVPANRWTSSFPREPEETPATCTPQVRASTQPKQGAREPVDLQLPEGTGGNTGHVHTASPGFHVAPNRPGEATAPSDGLRTDPDRLQAHQMGLGHSPDRPEPTPVPPQ